MEAVGTGFVAEAVGGAWEGGPPPRFICGVTQDSRACKRDFLYIALRGARVDGHNFLGEVAAAGGAAVIAADYPREKIPVGLAFLAVASPGEGLLRLGGAYRRRFRARVIGVTGSVGKTTTRRLLAAMLGKRGKTCETRGNWNNAIGLPLSLFGLDGGTAFGVFEAGVSHPGEMGILAEAMGPGMVVFTPPGEAHIGFFGGLGEIIEEKARLAAGLGEGGAWVTGVGEEEGGYGRYTCGGRRIRCMVGDGGVGGGWDYLGRPMGEGMRIEEGGTGESGMVVLPAPGGFMAEDVLRAAAAARACGVGWGEIAEAVAGYRGEGGRWERIRLANGVGVVNDAYNANPRSMAAGLAAFTRRHAGAGRFAVVGPMLELGEREGEAHRAIGRRLGEGGFRGVVVLSREGRIFSEDRAAVELAGAVGGGVEVMGTSDPMEAAHFLEVRMRAGDWLYLKASRGVRAERVLAYFSEGGGAVGKEAGRC